MSFQINFRSVNVLEPHGPPYFVLASQLLSVAADLVHSVLWLTTVIRVADIVRSTYNNAIPDSYIQAAELAPFFW
jgi:hypothetical protein